MTGGHGFTGDGWFQAGAGRSGSQGLLRRTWRRAVIAFRPCFTAVETYPRVAFRFSVASSLGSPPVIFCWVLVGVRAPSAWFEVGGTVRASAEGRASPPRSREA